MKNRLNRVLITGAAGYLGSNLYAHLEKSGYRPKGLVHKRTAPGQDSVSVDIMDPASLPPVFEGIDAVVHCAATVGAGFPEGQYEVNTIGTSNVLAAAAAAGVHTFVHLSSLAVMDEYTDHEGTTESAPYPQEYKDHYARSKMEAEELVRAKRRDLEVIILRPGWIWGPWEKGTQELFRSIEEGQYVHIGNGNNLTYLTHVDNMVCAVELALAAKAGLSGEVFHITDGNRLTMAEFVDIIVRELGAPPVTRQTPAKVAYAQAAMMERVKPDSGTTRQNVAIFSQNLHFDISKAKRVLGYDPDGDVSRHVRGIREKEGN